MASDPRAPRLAVLIDADNASSRIAAGLFEEIAKLGEVSVRRIYGDFSGTRLKAWADILPAHGIMAHQNFATTSGKNASDIALVIDAMDLLHSGRFEGFCLVSSDSDFTRLAARIREQGVDVYGFGEQKTPLSFRQACRRFIYTENLLPDVVAPVAPVAPAAVAAKTVELVRAPAVPAARVLRPAAEAVALITTAIGQFADGEGGWVSLGLVGKRLLELRPDFDARSFGHPRLGDLVRKAGAFEVETREGGGVYARVKPAAKKKAKGGP